MCRWKRETEVEFSFEAPGFKGDALTTELVFDVAQQMTRIAALSLKGKAGANAIKAG